MSQSASQERTTPLHQHNALQAFDEEQFHSDSLKFEWQIFGKPGPKSSSRNNDNLLTQKRPWGGK